MAQPVGVTPCKRDNIAETADEKWRCVDCRCLVRILEVYLLSEAGNSMWYVAVISAMFMMSALANPCGAQAPPAVPTPPTIQNQAVQIPQALPSAGVSDQVSLGPTASPTPGVGSTTSSSVDKRFGSAGQGLPGMPGGPPIKGPLGYQDPSSRYMRPPVIPPVLCDPAVNIPC